MEEITLKNFLHAMKESSDNGNRFCFILGSGASRESGIPTGVELSKRWLQEIQQKYSLAEIEDLKKKLNIKDISPNSRNYFDIYSLRFHPMYDSGSAYLERTMENAEPSFGFYPLAELLATTSNNLVITTNFDSLIEDALFIYTEKKPLVVGHELLADYINVNMKRPIVAKIHRGLFFDPQNRSEELEKLSDEWRKVLTKAFQVFTPVVIGYGGGDHTLMDFLKEDSLQLKSLYWCYVGEKPDQEDIIKLVDQKEGKFVPISGFDQMMFLLGQIFAFKNPCDQLKKVADNRVKNYEQQLKTFSLAIDKIKESIQPSETEEDVASAFDAYASEQITETELAATERPTAENYFKLGNAYFMNRSYQQAIDSFTKAIGVEPDNARFYSNRGAAYANLEKYSKALKDFNQAVSLNPNDADFYNNRGLVYTKKEQYDLALKDYEHAIDLNPNNADFYYSHGNAHAYLKQYDLAVVYYNLAITFNPNIADFYCNRGTAYNKLGQYEQALNDLNQAILLNPDNFTFYYNRGIIYKNLKQYEQALNDLNQAISLNPNDADFYNIRGIVYNKLGQFDLSLKDHDKAISLNPENASLYSNRGVTYMTLKQYELAEKDFDRAIKIDPNYVAARNNKKLLLKELESQ